MTARTFLDGRVVLHAGDCRDVIRSLPDSSVDSVVTDPPYALVSISKRFGSDNAAPTKAGKTGAYARASAGFMGQKWDTGETAFAAEFWAEVLRVLKPGGHLVAFSGTRTYHRMTCAIEDAGFEIRDQLAWTYATGFPKSRDIGEGRGTALKPAWEPIALARRPLSEGSVAANVLRWGTGAINIDGCRIATSDRINQPSTKGTLCGEGGWDRPWKHDAGAVAARDARAREAIAKAEALGRFPANVLHDGSDEVLAAFPESNGQQGVVTGNEPSSPFANVYGDMPKRAGRADPRGDTGSAARFFFSAKADADDRLGSKHPTVKPVDLMRWLVRLVTPPRGRVLDPFAGTGTTGEAAYWEGCDAVLIEREPQYLADIERRMSLVLGGPDERRYATIKARGETSDAGPLFADREAAE